MTPTPGTSLRTRWWYWLGLAVGPAGVVLAYVANARQWTWLTSREDLETAAIVLVIVTALTLLVRTAFQRQPFHLLLTALAAAILCREIHWDWTDQAVYAAIAAIALWAALWRKRLVPWLDVRPGTRAWLITTAVCYVFSQVIARRLFRDVLPLESDLHVAFEEIVENLAHACLLILALLPPLGAVGSERADLDAGVRDPPR